MCHHKKSSKCGCEKMQFNKKQKKLNSPCECKQKFYYPLPNLPTQPVSGMKIGTESWFAPGSVESCCSICSSVKPVYTNLCDTCRYEKGTKPINNTAYFTTGEYIY